MIERCLCRLNGALLSDDKLAKGKSDDADGFKVRCCTAGWLE